MLSQVLGMYGKPEAVVTGHPSDDGLPGSATGGAPAKPLTWGDRVLRRRIRVLQIEPCTQSRRIIQDASDSPIDGELYTDRCTRGNLRTTVLKGGTPKHPLGSTFLLHPFTGGSKGAGPGNGLPMRALVPKRRSIGDAEAPATEVTARAPNEIAA